MIEGGEVGANLAVGNGSGRLLLAEALNALGGRHDCCWVCVALRED